MCSQPKEVPVRDRLWTVLPSGEPRLVGRRCLSCGEVFAPGRATNSCIRCQHEKLEEIELGPLGRIVSFTQAMQPPAGGFYHGPVPYSYGLVDLDDGARVLTLLGGEVEQLRVEMRVKLVIETLYEDRDGNKVRAFRFTPIEHESADGGAA